MLNSPNRSEKQTDTYRCHFGHVSDKAPHFIIARSGAIIEQIKCGGFLVHVACNGREIGFYITAICLYRMEDQRLSFDDDMDRSWPGRCLGCMELFLQFSGYLIWKLIILKKKGDVRTCILSHTQKKSERLFNGIL